MVEVEEAKVAGALALPTFDPRGQESSRRMAQELEAQADELLDKYTALVPQLQATPYSRPLHLEHVEITKGLGLVEELDAARNLLNSYFPLSQGA